MKLLSTVLVFACFTLKISAQKLPTEAALEQANVMGMLFKAGNYKGYLEYIHPLTVKLLGGETNMIAILERQARVIKNKGVIISNIIFTEPSAIIVHQNELQITVSQHTELKSAKGRVLTFTSLIGVSADKGKTWKFIDISNKDLTILRKLYPNLSSKIVLPPKKEPKPLLSPFCQ